MAAALHALAHLPSRRNRRVRAGAPQAFTHTTCCPSSLRHTQLVRQLDGGGALEVSGIPDAFLRAKLTVLLDNLPQLRKNSAVRVRRAVLLLEERVQLDP